jgi:hypothetical protein
MVEMDMEVSPRPYVTHSSTDVVEVRGNSDIGWLESDAGSRMVGSEVDWILVREPSWLGVAVMFGRNGDGSKPGGTGDEEMEVGSDCEFVTIAPSLDATVLGDAVGDESDSSSDDNEVVEEEADDTGAVGDRELGDISSVGEVGKVPLEGPSCRGLMAYIEFLSSAATKQFDSRAAVTSKLSLAIVAVLCV